MQRYLQAVDVEQLAGSAGASLPGGGNSADYLSSAAAADVDADAARQYQMFMAGAKVSTAKMWSSSSLRDLPKVGYPRSSCQPVSARCHESSENTRLLPIRSCVPCLLFHSLRCQHGLHPFQAIAADPAWPQ
jgi:hypothetical protein